MLFGMKERDAAILCKILDIIHASPPYIIGGVVVGALVWLVMAI